MRDNIGTNPERVDDAKCGCERWEVDARDADGRPILKLDGTVVRSTTCLHILGCDGSAKVVRGPKGRFMKAAG